MSSEISAGQAKYIESTLAGKLDLFVDFSSTGLESSEKIPFSKAAARVNRRLLDNNGEIRKELTSDQIGELGKVLTQIVTRLDQIFEHLEDNPSSGDELIAAVEEIYKDEGGLQTSEGEHVDVQPLTLEDAVRELYGNVMSLAGKAGEEKKKREGINIAPAEKTEKAEKIEFNPAQYRSETLPLLAQSYKQLRENVFSSFDSDPTIRAGLLDITATLTIDNLQALIQKASEYSGLISRSKSELMAIKRDLRADQVNESAQIDIVLSLLTDAERKLSDRKKEIEDATTEKLLGGTKEKIFKSKEWIDFDSKVTQSASLTVDSFPSFTTAQVFLTDYNTKKRTLQNYANQAKGWSGVIDKPEVKRAVDALINDRIAEADKEAVPHIEETISKVWETKEYPQKPYVKKIDQAYSKISNLPSTVTELASLYAEASSAIQELSAVKGSDIAVLPDAYRVSAESVTTGYVTKAESVKTETEKKAFQVWKTDREGSKEWKDLNEAITRSTAIASDVPGKKKQESDIQAAVTALENQKKSLSDLLMDSKRVDAVTYINQKIETGNSRVTEIARLRVEQEKNTKEDSRKSLIDVITQIEKLNFDNPIAEAAGPKLADLESMRDALWKARDELVEQGVAINDVDSRYNNQDSKLQGLIERARIREMDLQELVDQLKYKKVNPFISPDDVQRLTDPVAKLLVAAFQKYAPRETDPIKLQKEKLDISRARIDIFCSLYDGKFAGADNMPAANTDELYNYMAPNVWGLERSDILNFTNDPREGLIPGTTVGQNVQESLQYLVDVVARNPDKDGYRPEDSEELDFLYPELVKAKSSGVTPSDRMKAFAEKKLVGTKLTKEEFEVMWKLYYTFDLFGVSLAKRQKWTQTRGHNTHQKEDPNYLSRPLHVAAQKLNRYGNDRNSLLWLLAFTGKYPNDWVYATNGEHGYHEEGIQHVQESTKTFVEAGMPTKGMLGVIYPTPELGSSDAATLISEFIGGRSEVALIEDEIRQDAIRQGRPLVANELEQRVLDVAVSRQWDQSVFPDQLDFLTKRLAKGADDVAGLSGYLTAQKGWQNLLDMTLGSTPEHMTDETILGDGGLWDKFVGQGLGTAKIIPGNHQDWFAPMMRYFLGRIGAEYVPEAGKNEVEARKHLTDEIIKRMESATRKGQGGLADLKGFDEILKDLKKNRSNAIVTFNTWAAVPDIFQPETTRQLEYEELVIRTFEDKYHKKAPVGERRKLFGIPIPLSQMVEGLYKGNVPLISGYTIEELRDFKDMMSRLEPPERPASRKKDTNTTASAGAEKK